MPALRLRVATTTTLLAAALAAGWCVGTASARGGGGHGGGGHGARTVVVVTGAGAVVSEPPFRGDEAAAPLQISDTPPAAAEGEMKIGDVIARYDVRAADAIVLLDDVKGRRRDVPAGVALARVRFAGAGHTAKVWCDVRPTGRVLYPQEHDCLEDTGGGRLDKLWQGDSQVRFLGFSLSGVGFYGDPMPNPARYRAAAPGERPGATLGFKYCDGDGVATPPRFALVLSGDGEPGSPLVGACRFGVWVDDSHPTTVDVAGMQISVTPEGPGVVRYRVVKRLPVEALGPLAPESSLVAVADPFAPEAGRRPSAGQPMLERVGEPAKVDWGAVSPGQVFATLSVRHALTGTLRNRIKPRAGLFGPTATEMEVGQAVFGFASPGVVGDGVAWCAPRPRPDVPGAWQSDCLAPASGGYLWFVAATPAMAPNLRAVASGVAGASSDPVVRPGPIQLPPMTLTLKLASVGVDRAGVPAPVFHIVALLDWGEGPQPIAQWDYELPPDGRRLQVLDVAMQLKRGAGETGLLIEPAPAPGPRAAAAP